MKNLKDFGGVPLLAHKIQQARHAGADEIWVSTDNQAIKDVAVSFDANVIDRPEIYAQDTSSTDDVLNHALEVLRPSRKDLILLLQVTSPLISVESIRSCINKLKSNAKLNCVISIHEAHPFLWTSTDNAPTYWEPKNHTRDFRPRRQDLQAEGWETGGCYVLRVSALVSQGNRYPFPTGAVNVGFLESLDIDTPLDLANARAIQKVMDKQGHS
jgi:CMP-N,N'-diacetyllegionaminic acid synthase